MKKNLIVALMILVGITSKSFAQKVAVEESNKAGWHKIAETNVTLNNDKDEVMVIGKDHFKAIKLVVTDEPVEFTDLDVVYENDQRQDIQVRTLIKPGGETRVIDLDGTNRAIKKIVLKYKTVNNPGHDRAHVEIWGMK